MTDVLTEKLDLILSALENGPRLTIEEPMSSVISSEVVALFGGVIVGFLTIALSYYAYLAQRNISVSTIKKRVNSEIYEVIENGICLKKQKNNKGKLVDGIDEYIYCE